jgi:hypothetical protein
LLKENGITTVYLALDNDERSREATQKLKEKLAPLVPEIHVIQWPEGVKDANEFFLSRGSEEFRKLLPQPCPAVESPATAGEKDRMTLTAQGFNWTTGGRLYDLCAIEKPSLGRLKATIKAMPSRALMDQASRLFFIDTVDFYLSRSRKAFVAEAARLFRETPEIIEEDVNQIILAVENYIAQTAENPVPVAITIPEGDRLEALRMLRSAGLIDEIQRDLGKLGLIGEEPNRLLLYLGMTSRKMDDPLAIQILSSSGAGKSYLQDAVLSLCPEEDLIKLTSLSGQALFYKGENSLKHKCLAIAEVAGAEGARYALRNLISDKKLTIESTVKNGMTGKLETQINLVWGPTAVFETTTNPKTDAETKSRYFLASVNESPEQTKAILEAQRNSHTLEGRKRKQTRLKITAKHHALQRLLEPITVVNPYEPLLTYGEDRLAFRRDQPKYLNLILTVTFLHQMQRPRKHDPELGDYIEVTLDDIAIANELAHRLFGQSLDDLSAPSREALDRITGYVEKKSRELKCEREKVEFSRRELREVFGWSDTRLRVYLGELVDMEYLAPVSGRNGMRFCYRLIDGGTPGERRIPGLKDVETLRKEAELSGIVQPLHLAAREENLAALNGHPAATPPQTNGEVKKGYDPRRNGHRPHPPAAAQETLVEIYG